MSRSMLETFLRAKQRVRAVNLIAVVTSLYYLAVIGLVASFDALSPARAVGVRVSMAGVGAIVAYLFLRRGGTSFPRPRIDPAVARRFLSYGVPYAGYSIFLMLSYRLDYLLLALWKGSAPVGVYSIAVTQAELLWILPVSVGFVLFPRAASRADRQSREGAAETASLARWSMLLTIVAAVTLAAIARPLISLMYGSAYAGAAQPLRLLLPGVVANVWLQILGPHLFGLRRLATLIGACAVGLAINVGLNVVLIPSSGASGAAAASSLSYAATAAILLVAFRRLDRDHRLNVFLPTPVEIGSRLRSVRTVLARA
jgi:O-antigen/teichoic acid export membrane protein